MVEIHLDGKVPEALLIIFGACTTLLVTIHLMALMISTCILPKIDAASSDMEDEKALSDSPHEKIRHFVELAWTCSTGLGIILFLVEFAILSWVKFLFASPNAAIACTVIVIPALIMFITFSLVYYRRLMALKYEQHEEELKDLETITHALIDNNTDESGAQAFYVV